MVGKATVRGTRITVEVVLDHLAANPDVDDPFAAYPRLTVEDLKAVQRTLVSACAGNTGVAQALPPPNPVRYYLAATH
jgi:hypothetical protein